MNRGALLNEAVMVISFTLSVDNPALKVNDIKKIAWVRTIRVFQLSLAKKGDSRACIKTVEEV